MGRGLRIATLATYKSRCTIDEKGCWNWLGSLERDGYGVCSIVWINGKQVTRVHRVTFYLANGALPPLLDHIECDNRRCCNPEHVEPSTSKQNILRGIGPTAINAQKTHCPKGHPYSGKAFRQGAWRRHCGICRNEQEKARRRRENSIISCSGGES